MKKRSFLDEFVHKKGRTFYAAKLPDDVQRGKLNDCFDHCLIEAVRSKGKYRYCEGKALFSGQWIHHSWLTDAEGVYAYDPTWYASDNRTGKEIPLSMIHYLGAILDTELVVSFVTRTKYKSPFANHAKAPHIAQLIYDTAT